MSVQIPLADAERQQLREQYAEIATLAGGLAHEIRNPLSTISLNLEMLNEDLEQLEAPQARRMQTRVQSVQKECHNLERILEDFLQFARAGQIKSDPVDLNDVVRDFLRFWQPQAAEAHVDVRPHLASDLPPVLADRSLLRQALLNLAINARQAMPNGGLLELQTCLRDGQVVLEMIDTGAGMDARTREKIFEAFFSTRPGGSGLGLPTVRRIVDAHHGTICCDSEPGRGTRFTISLPAAGAAL